MTTDDFKSLVGKTVQEANANLPPRYRIFVAEKDGTSFYKTYEYNPFRINVIVHNDKIYKILDIG